MSIIEEIKDRVRIEQLVAETTSVRLRKSGANYVGFCPFHVNQNTPALVVWSGTQTWKCFGCNKGGDVFHWVIEQNPGWDLKEAIRHLAGKANITLQGKDGDLKERVAAQAKEDALRVAMRVMRRWLVGEVDRKTGKTVRDGDKDALAYALDRGWTMETIKAEGIGFSGRATAAELNEMRGEFQLHGIDPLSPQAVMVMGFKGDVAKWAESQGLDPSGFGKNFIQGFMNTPGLMYAHKFNGQIEFLSQRFLPGFDAERKSHNVNSLLAGPKRPYFNSLHREHHAQGRERGEAIYIVEGQGCSVTWRQFDKPAMALCGSSWRYLVESGEIEMLRREYENIFYVTDADTPGELVVTGNKNDFPLATHFGGGLWIARTPKMEWQRNGGSLKAIKDTNDVAQYLMDIGVEKGAGKKIIDSITEKAEPIIVLAARYAGSKEGPVREQTMMKLIRPMLVAIPNQLRVSYSDVLAEALYPSLGKTERMDKYNKWVNGELRKAAKESADEDDDLAVEETLGGWYPDDPSENSGYLIDVFYDLKDRKLRFAYAHITDMKKNAREIGTANFIVMKGKKLQPPMFDEPIATGALKVAHGLGTLQTTGYLIERLAEYYQRFFYMEQKARYRFFASWSLATWVFDSFDAFNFLRARGGSGSGKSDLLYLVGLTSFRFAVTLSTTTSASYRGLAKLYKASIMIDEADDLMKKDDGSMNAFLKGSGMKRTSNSFNMMETMTPNGKIYVPSVTPVYGPRLITMYKSFADAGIENRCVTFDLSQVDTMTLDKHDMEPGFYPPEIEDEAVEFRNMCLRWRLETWMPKIELPLVNGKRRKLSDPLVSPRVNQVLRPMKVLAVLQNDEDLLNDLMMIGRSNYEDEMIKRAGSFEAMALRTIVALDIAADLKTGAPPQASKAYVERVSGYKDVVQVGKLGRHGLVRFVTYKEVAKIMNEIMDFENLADGTDDNKKKSEAVKSRTIGEICREAFRLPVERTGGGWVVILDRERIDIAKLRFGLDREADYQAETIEPIPTQAELPQAGIYNAQTGRWE